ncbi:phiKZ-like phage internal head proteins [Caballeronia arationis]|uniref:hypothetical protein n=1 Tax=Caballeronia arationis TaxID=1777142 RepID=UPI00074C2CD1|nr:hypothetical protein [Caballeronia arationis]SAK83797.1 phiKZ-like phage internal head proteins [Caballeronia arationis]
MRRISHRGLVAAMEEENLLPEEAETNEVSDLANSQEEGLTDIAEDEAGLAEHDALTDEAVETAEALESIRDDLKAALESGGLEQGGAAILRTSLSHMYGRVGLRTKRVSPALESFGSISRREDATKIALEEVKENVKKMWETIVAAIKKAIEWVKNFVTKLFDNNAKMVARANELKEMAGKVEGEPSVKEIKNAGIAGAVHVGGKVDGIAAAAQLHKAVEGVVGKYADWAKMLEGPMSNLGDAGALSKAVNYGALGLADVHDAASQGIPAGENAKVGRSVELPGGKALVVVISGDPSQSTAGIMPFNKSSAEFKGESAPVLVKEAMIKVADEVIAIGAIIERSKQAVAESERGKGELMKAVEQEQGKEEGAGEAIKNARAILKLADTPFVALTSYAVKSGRSLNQLVEQSIKAYGAKKEEAKPEAKPEPAAA